MQSNEWQWKWDHFHLPTSHDPVKTTLGAISLLCFQSTPLPHVQLAICQDPQVLLGRAVLQPVNPQAVSPGIAVLVHIVVHNVPISPFLQPVSIPLNGGLTPSWINCSPQFDAIHNKSFHQQLPSKQL